MPRCTRCNTPLNNSSGEEATKPDPGARRPLPPPWSAPPADPPGWASPPPATPQYPPPPPPGGPGETSISLSPEPWDETTTSLSPEPWDEPAIWQPPGPSRKKGKPYLLIAAGVVALTAVALTIILWPSGDKSAGKAGDALPQQSQTVTDTGDPSESPAEEPSSSASPSGDLTEQAGKVDGLLSSMSATRSDLGNVVESGCGSTGLQRIRSARQSQLDQARALDVGALDNGTELKDALVRALQASVDSNKRYLEQAPGCPTEGDPTVSDANSRATQAKTEFLGYWNTVAPKAGLSPRSEGDI